MSHFSILSAILSFLTLLQFPKVTQEKPDILGEQLWRSLADLPLGPPNKEKQAKAKL
jgi:hypothetical protein